MAEQATLVLIKPDAIARGIAGAVYSRLESLELEVVGAKVVRVSRELAQEHYASLREKAFFEELLDFIEGKLHDTRYVLAFVLFGESSVERIRELAGATDPKKAQPRSIRGSMGRDVMENLLHASATPAEAEREIKLWFSPSELTRDLFPAWKNTIKV